jgi:energy-coupling factor transporter ATP-binding protein EcfA2
MKKLHLSKDVTFDLDVMMQTVALLGNKGSGKTMTMQMLFELVHRAAAQAVAITPVSNWWSVLYDESGKGPGLVGVYVFGGKRAHYPLRPQDGKLIAQLLVRKRISAVIDVSMFRKGERRRFLTDFFDEFYHLKKMEDAPAPSVLFLEEAHAFCPQRPQPDEAQMLGAVEDICREGRNYGIGFVLGDQRPATVNKNVLALVEVLIALRTTFHLDRKVYVDWIEQHGIESEIDIHALLPHFKAGEAIVYAPLYNILKRTQLNKKTTFDASATQKIGVKAAHVGELTKVDDAELRAAMAEVEQEIASSDPKALQRKIRELEAELQKKPAAAPAKPIEVPVFTKEQAKAFDELNVKIGGMIGTLEHMNECVYDLLEYSKEKFGAHATAVLQQAKVQPIVAVTHRAPPVRLKRARAEPVAGEPIIKKGGREMIRALATFHPEPLTKDKISTLSGMAQSGTFTDYLSAMRRCGYIEDRPGGIGLTELGIEYAVQNDLAGAKPATTDELLATWLPKFKHGAREMLQPVVRAYPAEVTRSELAAQVGMAESGTFTDYLSALVRAGLVEKPSKGTVRAAAELFP